MNIQNILHNIEEDNMQSLLTALEKGKVSLSSNQIKDIPQEIIDKACQLKLAYNVGNKALVTKKYVYDRLLTLIKENPTKNIKLEIENIPISPSFINNILENLIQDGLIEKENQTYIANYKKIISKEKIEGFLRNTIGVVSVSEVIKYFGFEPFIQDHGDKVYSNVTQYCKNILDTLVAEGKAAIYNQAIDHYYWIEI